MFIYENESGSHVCHGAADLMKAEGCVPTPRHIVMTDESGALVGVQGGGLTLEKSMTMIKSLREGEALMKAKPAVTKKSETPLRKSFGQSSFESGLANLNRKMAEIRAMQR